MKKTIAIATVLMAAAVTGILSTNPIAFAQDESETNTGQEIKQKNVGSGDSTNNNCALNSIDSLAATVECPVTQVGPRTATLDEPTSTFEEPTSTLDEPTSTLDEPTSTLDEPTSTFEEPTSTFEELPPTPAIE
jgi:hypothetical protein